MKYYRFFTILLIVILAIALVPGGVVYAFPPLPSSFYGVVKQNGGNLPAGTTIQALINNQVYATASIEIYQGNSVYSLTVPGDDPGTAEVEGGKDGDAISFKINGELAAQTGTWESGTNVKLDLTITSSTIVVTSTLTNTPQATQTGTLPLITATPTPAQQRTENFQYTPASTQTQIETLQGNEPELIPFTPSDGELTGTIESLNASQTPESNAGVSNENPSLLPPENKGEENLITAAKNNSWWFVVIGFVILAGIGSGIWYFRKKSKPDQDLL